ncbi:N-acetylmuramoyl-L-alanine amidase [Blautia sp. XA-2221]|uniref:N-acetylmuramoyl-L-alanine amidase n=1 Tax=Blautia sp. XA-2221 TaxID=2903961 RepID=UPI002378580E|nr:N-acetylmuramoyl-L-alanine amidase [Blautia sp. XA-2221]
MKKYVMELVMSGLLLVCFLLLSRQAAQVSGNTKSQGNNREVIAVDPGHGGGDPGMIGVDNLKEKGINLEIARKLERVLTEKGYRVVMTRKEDQGLYDPSALNKKAQDMQRRIALLEEVSPVLTVSIHQNSYSDPSVRGPQVFYYESSQEGKKLAQAVQEEMNQKLLPQRPRQIKGNTSYYLLKRSKGTLVIVECGFLTNPEEAELLQKEEYQQKVAGAVADGIESYLNSRK